MAPTRCLRPAPTRSWAWPTTRRSRPRRRRTTRTRRSPTSSSTGSRSRAPRATRSRSAPTRCSRPPPSSTSRPSSTAPATRRPKTLNNDQYFWRIRATDAAGFKPDWSSRPVWRFKRNWPDQPTLLYPQNNATNVQNPFYFQWTPVKHASSYVVQISSGAGFPTPAPFPQQCTTVHTTLVYGDDARQLLAHRARHVHLAGHGQGRVLQRDAGHRRDRRPGRDVHLQAAAGHDDRAAQRQHLRRPVRPGPVPRGTRPHVEPGRRGGQVQGDHPGDDDDSPSPPPRSATRPETWPPAPTPGTSRRSTRSARSAPGTRPVSGPSRSSSHRWSRTSRTTPDSSSCMPVPDPLPAAGPPNPTTPDLGLVVPVPVADLDPGHLGRPLRDLRGARGQHLHPGRGRLQWAAGDDTGTTRLNPGNYQWYVKAVRKDGATLTGSTGTFTIMSLPDIPVESYKAALTGNALTGNAGTAVDTCNLKLPSNCQNLRATPVLGWDSPDANVGHYVEVLSQGRRAHQPDRDQGHRQHDVPGPRRAPGQPGRLGVLRGAPPVRRGRRLLLADPRHALVQQADPAADPDLARSTAPRCRTTSRSPGTTTSTARAPAPTRTRILATPGQDEAAVLQRPDRVGPELRPERHHDQGRPDDVHLVRRHLPRGHHLVAGPGGRPERQHAGLERAALAS